MEIRSEEVQEIMSRNPHWMIRWGNIIILFIVFLLIFFSWLIRYPDIVTAEVLVTTQIPPQKLVAKHMGRIDAILVKNNQFVAGNTPLAVLENSANYKDVFLLKSIVDTLKVGTDFIFPFDKIKNPELGDIELAYATFQKDYIAYRLNTDLNPHSVTEMSQKNEMILLRERYKLLTDQKDIAEQEALLKKNELERFKKLYQKGVIASQEWENKNMEYLRIEKGLKDLYSTLSQIKSSLNEMDTNSKNTKINETRDDITLYRNTIDSYGLLKKAIDDWDINHILRSSIPGEVSFMKFWVPNQVVAAGEEVFAVIPSKTTAYLAKVKAGIKNSGKIRIGQKVNIKLANYPEREFGVIKGNISAISTTPDENGNILIDVDLPQNMVTTYHKRIEFKQEMSGSADIITDDLRLLQRVFYQFRDII